MATVAEDGQSDGLPTDSDLPTDEDELVVRDSEDELEVSWACPHDCVPQGSDLQIRLQAKPCHDGQVAQRKPSPSRLEFFA